MKDNSKADVSHTDEFDKMYQEMVKQVEDEYKVKPVYQPKRDLLYQECLDAAPEEIKEMVSLEVEFSNFVSLVRKMRDAQERAEMITGEEDINFIDILFVERREAEREVDEYLKKMEE